MGFTQLGFGGYQSLALAVPLRIVGFGSSGQNPAIRFPTFSGQQYSVQCSTNLVPGVWSDLPGSPVVGTGYEAIVIDTNATAAASRYYRIKQN